VYTADHRYRASASCSVSVHTPDFAGTHCTYPQMAGQVELAWVAGYIPGWFTCLQMVTHPSTHPGLASINFSDATNDVTKPNDRISTL